MDEDEEIAAARREAAADLAEQARGCTGALGFFAVLLAAVALVWLCWTLEKPKTPASEQGPSRTAPYFPLRP